MKDKIKTVFIASDLIAIVIAVLGLLGYLPGLRFLGSVREDYIPMAPSTAVSFIILAAILLILKFKSLSRPQLIVVQFLAVMVALFGALEVAGHFLGVDLNFEHALVPIDQTLNGIPLGRMSPVTGAGFFLTGLAVILIVVQYQKKQAHRLNQYVKGYLCIATLLTSLMFCLAYFHHDPLLYNAGNTIPMALTTALGFLFLCIALMAFERGAFPLRFLVGVSTQDYLLRFLFPFAILVAMLTHYLNEHAELFSALNPAFTDTFEIALIVAVTVFLTKWMASFMVKGIRQMDEDLRKSKYYLEKSQEMGHMGTWEMDLATNSVYWTEEAYRIFGMPVGTPVTYETFLNCVHPDDRERVNEEWTAAVAGKPYDIDHRVLTSDGTVKWVREKAFLTKDKSGKPVKAIGFVQDITERRAVEDRFRSIFDMSVDMMCIANIKTATFLVINPAFTKTLGYTQKELCDRSFLDFIHPDDKQKTVDIIEQKLREGETVISFENRYRHKDGHYLWLDWNSNSRPEEGVTFAIAKDVTSGKKMFNELLEAKTKYSLLVEGTEDLVTCVDANGILTYVNSASEKIFGLKPEDCVGRAAFDFIHPDDCETTKKDFAGWVANEVKHVTHENRQVNQKTGQVFDMLWTISFNYDNDGNLDNVGNIARDITEMKQTKENLKLFRNLIDVSGDVFAVIEPESAMFLDTNEQASTLLGYSRDELLKMRVYDIDLRMPDKNAWNVHVQEVREKRYMVFESMAKCKDGSTFPIETSVNLIEISGVERMVAITRDISWRKRIEEKTREQKEFLDQLLNITPYTVFWKDRNSVYQGCNDNFAKLAGLKDRADIVGKSDYDLPWSKDEADFYRKIDREVMDRECPQKNIEETQTTASGKKTTILTSKVPIYDEGGRVVGMLGMFVDITGRKQMEQELLHREKMFRGLFDNSPTAIMVHNHETGEIIDANQRAIDSYGFRDLDEFQKNDFWLDPPYSSEDALGWIHKAYAQGPQSFEWLNCRRSDGAEFWEQVVLRKVEINGVDRVLATCIDITEQKRAAQEVLDISKFPEDNPDPVLRIDKSGKVLYKNSAADRLLKHKRLFKKDVFSILPKGIKDSVTKALAQGVSMEGMERVVSGRVYSYTLAPIVDAGYVNLYGTDVTERKRAAKALRDSEEMYRLITENTKDFIAIATFDLNVTLKYISPAYVDTLGYETNELLGQSAFKLTHPDDKRRFYPILLKNLTKKVVNDLTRKQEPLFARLEYRLRKKDGTWLYVEGNISEVEGQLIFVQRDITERRKSAELLRSEKIRNEQYINSLPGLFYVFDEKQFVHWNHQWEQVTGYSSEEIGNMYGTDFFEGQDRERIAERMREVFAGKDVDVYADLVTKQGERIPYYFTGLRREFDGKNCLLGLGVDVSRQREVEAQKAKLQQQVFQAQKLESVGTIASGIAHNFNNYLGVVRGFIELAQMDTQGQEKVQSELAKAVQGIEDAKELSDKMLTFSRTKERGLKLVKINSLLEDAMEFSKRTISSSTKMHVKIDQDCGFVMADANELKQAVLNLCINAYHAVKETGGSINVGLRQIKITKSGPEYKNLPAGEYAELKVSDTGVGMDEATAARIFEPFFTTKEAGQGTGLGLSVVHGIIREYNGAITVDSQPGKGTTFCVFLPIVEQ